MDKALIRENIKVLLNIQDRTQDALIDVIINHTMNHLELMLGKSIPDKLEFIVVEVSIVRFNRRGAEGMDSETVEGHQTSFNNNDFRQYLAVIDNQKDMQKTGGGGVKFFP